MEIPTVSVVDWYHDKLYLTEFQKILVFSESLNQTCQRMTTVKDFKSYTDIEHVKAKPSMYIGAIQNCKEARWIIEDKENTSEKEAIHVEIDSNPGLEQCILELMTNAADHAQRCKTLKEQNQDVEQVSKIKITLEKDNISIYNNGQGIPLETHPDTKLYIPEMIFFNLRTSSNYDDTQKRTVGGTNGVGAKAANIFSVKFVLELQTNGKKYYQEFTNGMKNKTVPKITKATTKGDYTRVTYYPDFALFGMVDFDSNQTATLVKKRVYDLSAATGKEITVWYTEPGSAEEKVPVKDFTDYMSLFIGDTKKVVYKTDRWEVGFALCPYDQATQISFVNAICTEEGGSHVTHVLDPVLTKITAELQSKSKGVTIKKQYIKDNVIIFIKALIENPSFNSQLKRKLETKVGDFGSRCDIPDDVIKKIAKLGICDNVMDIAKAKEMKDAMKKIDGTKNVRLSDIKKLEDANFAGTSKAMECTLILTEGDSAKSLALNGITSAGGRNKWGVFPLRGKFINIRNATAAQLVKNEEIIAVNRIMGLKVGMTDITKLRYGKVMLMTDSDSDGFHIKGLLINYFTFNWPELVEQGLLECMITPLIKVFKGKTLLKQFYNLNDYKKWIEDTKPTGTREKYYKGLGTSTAVEAKEYFTDLASNRKEYKFKEETDLPIIVRTFDKNHADARKDWITAYLKNPEEVDYTKKNIQIDYFINRELVQFSVYDNVRSIPNVIDGFKPSQRKILFGCLKKKLFLKADESGDIKVAQLAGYISEQTAYHHGEVSLQGTIINMAQDFVGSNGINLLLPIGNFGSRQGGGSDAASPRYIYTALRSEVRILFNEMDNKLLNYLEEEGSSIEPEFYVPIVPMLLVNGSTGIGTGWSTNIPCFKLEDIVHNLKLLMKDEDADLRDMNPYYRDFKGTITKESDNCWKSTGLVEYIDKNTVEITELPVGMLKEDFKEYLDKLIDSGLIKSVVVNDNDKNKNLSTVCYRVKLIEPITKEDLSGLIEFFKLEKNINGTNMVAFDEKNEIQKYGSVEDILWTFYKYRLSFYVKRHVFMTKTLEDQIAKVSEKLRFVLLIIDDKIVVFKKTKSEIANELTKHKFEDQTYLLAMPLHKFTREEVDLLKKELSELTDELKVLKGKTEKDLWMSDLDKLSLK